MDPYRAIIPELDDDDESLIVQWGEENEGVVHEYAIAAAVTLHTEGEPGDFVVIVEFYTTHKDIIPFGDIIVEYDEIPQVLDDAELYYVRVEEYEKAAEVKTLREKMNIKTKIYGK